ncbi:unnamed protein product [Rotaria socialis]|uniref:Serine aminopeptidase S33 domain-containing protein n=1 Tax=Rotaria socialis TaxID=392032 RepID=A0A818DL77_9BILA|nr:unnamed protein product [Rotaria socialis]CAF3655415.1 unnamed protein product [Rotaria socialis]CAF4404965.1 unnamed protein product [Rotaria socialis]CAF4471057.1 unnamed protein product [Rotaria socialis]
MESSMVESQFDGLKLHMKKWHVPNAKTVLLIIPGYGDHIERYDHLIDYLNKHNVAVVGIDLRGQGQSHGERGYTPHVEAILDDVATGIEKVHDWYKYLPLFMYGDGVGAAILCAFENRRCTMSAPYQGLILCTPSIAFPKKPNFIHLALVSASSFLAPHTRAPVLGGDYKYTNDPEIIAARENDLYYHDRWTAHTCAILIEEALNLEKVSSKFSVPTLIQHGSEAFLPMEKVQDFVDRAKKRNPNKHEDNITFQTWKGFHAELHNDLRRKEVFLYTLSWIETQLQPLKTA